MFSDEEMVMSEKEGLLKRLGGMSVIREVFSRRDDFAYVAILAPTA